MKFVNTVTPFLRVYNPKTGGFAQFQNGIIELEEGDPNYEWVMAEAQRNPAISIHVHAATCALCGESFTGKTAAAELGKHRKAIHFDAWLADKDAADSAAREVQVKARAGFVCDICQPVQEFGTADDLAAHVRLLHAKPPELTESGETIGEGGEGGGAEVNTEIPAATPSGG